MLLSICHELFYIVWHKQMVSHNTFALLQVSELCFTFSYNCGDEFWYSDMTNILRPSSIPSIPKLTRSGLTTPSLPLLLCPLWDKKEDYIAPFNQPSCSEKLCLKFWHYWKLWEIHNLLSYQLSLTFALLSLVRHKATKVWNINGRLNSLM